jgi:uncharacterized protein YceK
MGIGLGRMLAAISLTISSGCSALSHTSCHGIHVSAAAAAEAAAVKKQNRDWCTLYATLLYARCMLLLTAVRFSLLRET